MSSATRRRFVETRCNLVAGGPHDHAHLRVGRAVGIPRDAAAPSARRELLRTTDEASRMHG
eukprot:5415102-Pleurochrysis_carterae.AAC.1